MTRIVSLSKETHRTLKVDMRASSEHDSLHFVQVIVKEFPQLLVHYPILFSKDSKTGQFYCGAMLGLEQGENLFLSDWRERNFYRPLALQRGPFYARGPELAIDLDDPRVGSEDGKLLFTDRGAPTRYLSSIMYVFQDLQPGKETTQRFIARLLELNLIEPIDVEAELDDGRTHRCAGLYTIDRDMLSKLPDTVVVELFRRDYLRLIYLMIASLKQFPMLARKKNARLLEATKDLAGADPRVSTG